MDNLEFYKNILEYNTLEEVLELNDIPEEEALEMLVMYFNLDLEQTEWARMNPRVD